MTGSGAADARQANSAALPWPAYLPDELNQPRVAQLTSAVALSHGLSDGTALGRAAYEVVRSCSRLVQTATKALNPQARTRCAASSKTAPSCVQGKRRSEGGWSG